MVGVPPLYSAKNKKGCGAGALVTRFTAPPRPSPTETLSRSTRGRWSSGKFHHRRRQLRPAIAATVLDAVAPASTSLRHSSSPLSGSPSTNPRWPAQAPLQALKVLYLSLSLSFSVYLCRSRNFLYSDQGKRKRSSLIYVLVDPNSLTLSKSPPPPSLLEISTLQIHGGEAADEVRAPA